MKMLKIKGMIVVYTAPLNWGSLCQKFGYTFGNFLGGIENSSICFQTCHFLFCYDGPYIPENKTSFKTWYVCTYFSKTIRNRFLGFYGMYVCMYTHNDSGPYRKKKQQKVNRGWFNLQAL